MTRDLEGSVPGCLASFTWTEHHDGRSTQLRDPSVHGRQEAEGMEGLGMNHYFQKLVILESTFFSYRSWT